MLEYIKLPVQCVYFFRGATAQHRSEKWITHSRLCCSTLSLLIFSLLVPFASSLSLSLLSRISIFTVQTLLPTPSSAILPAILLPEHSTSRRSHFLQFRLPLSPSVFMFFFSPCLSRVIPTLLLLLLPSPPFLPSFLLACSFPSCLCLGTPTSHTAY